MKRKIISFVIIVLSVGAIYQVASYSTAEVKNTTSVTITSPEDALIAMPDELELKATRTTTITKSIVSEEGKGDIVNVQSQSEISTPTSNFYIKNNMNILLGTFISKINEDIYSIIVPIFTAPTTDISSSTLAYLHMLAYNLK